MITFYTTVCKNILFFSWYKKSSQRSERGVVEREYLDSTDKVQIIPISRDDAGYYGCEISAFGGRLLLTSPDIYVDVLCEFIHNHADCSKHG